MLLGGGTERSSVRCLVTEFSCIRLMALIISRWTGAPLVATRHARAAGQRKMTR